MRTGSDMRRTPTTEQFESHAAQGRASLLREMLVFMSANKKWWLAPIVVVLLLAGFLIMLAGTAAGPLIYTLF